MVRLAERLSDLARRPRRAFETGHACVRHRQERLSAVKVHFVAQHHRFDILSRFEAYGRWKVSCLARMGRYSVSESKHIRGVALKIPRPTCCKRVSVDDVRALELEAQGATAVGEVSRNLPCADVA